MKTPKTNLIKPTDLRAQAQELIESNKMPSLKDVMSAVAEAREKYRDRILAARHSQELSEESEKIEEHD